MANRWYLNDTVRATTNILRRGELKFAEILKDEVNRRAPGSIKEHTKVQVTLRGVKVVNDHPAAQFVEFGTVPHVITPKTKKVLKWVDDAGDTHFAKLVHHPGTDPNPFFRTGVIAAKFRAREAF